MQQTNLEEKLQSCGDFGLFQKTVLFLMMLSPFFHGSQTTVPNFLVPDHEHWCSVPALSYLPFSSQKYIGIPYDDQKEEYASCEAFDIAWEDHTHAEFMAWNRSVESAGVGEKRCTQWTYDYSISTKTSTSQWDLVCSRDWLRQFMSAVYVSGLFLGSLVSGRISDKIGRKRALAGFSCAYVVLNIGAAVAPSYEIFTVVRFLLGFTVRGCALCSYIYVLEAIPSSWRIEAGCLNQFCFGVGIIAISLYSMALRDFRKVHYLLGATGVVNILICLIIPESPKWCTAKKKYDKAKDALAVIASINQKIAPTEEIVKEDIWVSSVDKCSQEQSSERITYADLFTSKVIRRNLLIIHFSFMAVMLVNVSLNLNLSELTGDVYLNVLITGVMDAPACLITYLILRTRPRVTSIVALVFFSSATAFASVAFELFTATGLVATMMSILCRAGTAGAILVNMLIVTEIFPTTVRQMALGSCMGMASAVSISGSYIGGPLRQVWRPLPSLIYGLLTTIAGFLCLFLPETLGRDLPDTVVQAESLSRKKIGENLNDRSHPNRLNDLFSC